MFRDSESLGKRNGKKWSQIWTFLFWIGLKSPHKKNLVFLLILPYKTCWKSRFLMDERPLVEGYIANFGLSLDVFEFLRFGWFFPFFEKFGFLGIFGPPYRGIDATIRIDDGWVTVINQSLKWVSAKPLPNIYFLHALRCWVVSHRSGLFLIKKYHWSHN